MSKIGTSSRHKHFRLDQAKITRARQITGARTETEVIEQALDLLIAEEDRNEAARAAHERFLRDGVSKKIEIRDAFGALDGEA